MNICQVILSEGWGGAETVAHELARYLRDRGENVSIILNEEIMKYYVDLENVKLFNIGSLYHLTALTRAIISAKSEQARPLGDYTPPQNRILLLAYSYSRELLAYAYYEKIRKQVMQFVFDNHIDVLHSHMAGGALLVSALGNGRVSRINTPHGEHLLTRDARTHPLMRPLVKWNTMRLKKALNEVDKVVEVSVCMLDDYERRGIVSRGKGLVIHNGVSISEIQASFGSTSKLKGQFNLLFPGGAKFVKGGDLIIRALSKVRQDIPDIHLYVALTVPKGHRLRKMVLEKGLEQNVTFAGFLPVQEFRKLLNSVDVMVLPSRQEAFSLVCLEAMALGKPVVASNVGGIREVIQDGRNGIIVEPDADQIAEAIVCLCRNEDLRREMSQNAPQDVARFDWSLIVERYIKVYRELSTTRMKLNACMLVGHLKHDPRDFLQPEIEVCGHIANWGHNVTLIGPPLQPLRAIEQFPLNGIDAYVMPYSAYLGSSSFFARVFNNTLGAFRRVRFILGMFTRRKYNLIFVGSAIWDQLLAIYLKMRYKVAVVFIIENPLEQGWETHKLVSGKHSYIYYPFFRFKMLLAIYVMRNADLVVTVDKWQKASLAERGIPDSKMEAVPECVNLELFSKKKGNDIRKKYALGDSRVIIYIGTMDEPRNLKLVIRTFAQVAKSARDVKLLMVGEGRDRASLEKLSGDLGIEDDVVFTGQVPHSDIPNFIAAADIGISPVPPLPFYKMSSPIKILEYMVMAKPVVANEEIPAHEEAIEQSGGGVLTAFSEDAFANAIVELLNNPGKATDMGKRGQEWVVKNRSYDMWGRRLEARYLKLVA